jgi:uncharacterized repeat protein (TIGR04076 family)
LQERFTVKIKVISQKGICAAGHKVGDEYIIDRHTPESFCIFAYSALDPDIRTLMFNGAYPWSEDKDVYIGCCPDPVNPVVFEVRRIREDR